MIKPAIIVLGVLIISTTSCVVVRQGEFGVKRKLGKYEDKVYTSGMRTFNPFTSTFVKISGQTENIEVSVNIPSREGLTIQSEVSILYNVVQKDAPELLRNVGLDYEQTIILPVFRSAVADVTAKYYAKDMHSGGRAEIETSIRELMMQTLSKKGIIVEAVLLKSIVLPRNLTKAIEDKLEAEQQAQRMEFILQQEKQEAERKRIAAELHDSLGQQLLVIKNWAMIGLTITPGETPLHEPLNEISGTASQAIEEVREVIYDLRPYQLDKIGLASTLRYMIEKVATASGIAFQTGWAKLTTCSRTMPRSRFTASCRKASATSSDTHRRPRPVSPSSRAAPRSTLQLKTTDAAFAWKKPC